MAISTTPTVHAQPRNFSAPKPNTMSAAPISPSQSAKNTTTTPLAAAAPLPAPSTSSANPLNRATMPPRTDSAPPMIASHPITVTPVGLFM
ncbi:MAG: hypothetical protein HGA39_02885 [Coriobacteriia bacterium]|nr:hypothetical protein [Coriobacteriia bacterium]